MSAQRKYYVPRGLQLPASTEDSQEAADFASAGNPWNAYFEVLALAQRGNFSRLAALQEIVHLDDGFFLWRSCCQLAGYAGSWRSIEAFVRSLQPQFSERGVPGLLAITLEASCNLQATPLFLELHQAADDEDDRHRVELHLSMLLEKSDDVLAAGASEVTDYPEDPYQEVIVDVDRQSYFDLATMVARKIELAHTQNSVPIHEGTLVDIAALARRLDKRLNAGESDSGRMFRERLAFEAATGIDTSPFYKDNGALDRLTATAIMEDFLEGPTARDFNPGQRYFFGHPIPL